MHKLRLHDIHGVWKVAVNFEIEFVASETNLNATLEENLID